jgi:UDP-glucose 4-epimerase
MGVKSIVGVARRLPTTLGDSRTVGKVSWTACDISRDPLDVVVDSDVVVDLAWLIQPSRDEEMMMRTNVAGTRRVADAVAFHDVPAFI